MTVTTINVADMHCSSCIGKVRKALNRRSQINELVVNPARRQLFVNHESDISVAELIADIEALGFHPYLPGGQTHTEARRDLQKRLGVAGIAMMQVMMSAVAMYFGDASGMDANHRQLLETLSLVFCLPVVGYAALPFYLGALRAFRQGLNMDVPIAFAIVFAFSVSLHATLQGSGVVYYDSVSMFAFLLLVARYLDEGLRTELHYGDDWLKRMPHSVCRLGKAGSESISIDEVSVGDCLLISEGEQLPADGHLESAYASVDESSLTGESVPRNRQRGELVYAGSYNRGGLLQMKVVAPVDCARIATIAALSNRAFASRPKIAHLADRIATIFIPCVLGLALLTYLGWYMLDVQRAVSASLAVLVVSCPCALSLAIPAAMSAAMLRLRQAGVVLTRGDLLETLPSLNRIVLDKTGTLTSKAHEVVSVERLGEYSLEQCWSLAKALQAGSSHPLASAFQNHNLGQPDSGLHLVHLRMVPGRGVQAMWHGVKVRIGSASFCSAKLNDERDHSVWLSADGIVQARFVLRDSLRPDAVASVRALKRRGLRVSMLSGDARSACESIANDLDIDFVSGESPESKLAHTAAHQARGETVAYVGDGINDLPVIAQADVAIAMLDTPDLVRSRADVMLLTSRLASLLDLVDVSRRARRIMRQNVAWAVVYNSVAIPMAVAGIAPPWLAALGMASSSVIVMLNATRLLRAPLQKDVG